MKTGSDTYKGQYLKPRKRADGSCAWYFKPKPDQIPDGWLKRYDKAVRVPMKSEQRVGGAVEKAHAMVDAANLFAEFNKMRRAPEDGGRFPHGSLRWICAEYRASDWFTAEIADATRTGYESVLQQIEAWAEERAAARGGVHRPFGMATTQQLQTFIDRWKGKPTRQRHLKSMLSTLCRYGVTRGVMEANPATGLHLARRKKGGRQRQVVLWDQAFVDAFIQIAQERGLPEMAAWVQTMWDIGRRPTDLYNLVVLDDLTRIRLNRGEITEGMFYDPETRAVRGWQQKNRAFGQIPLDPLTVKLIEQVRPRVEDGANQRHVFIDSRFGEPFTTERFPPQFRPIAKAAGLEGTTPQMGRHACIMRYRRAGMSFEDIMEITGHFDPNTIKKYYVVEDDSRLAEMKAKRAAAEGRG